MPQAAVVACLQERAPSAWLKRWKLAGPTKRMTRTTNCEYLRQAFRSFYSLGVQTSGGGAGEALVKGDVGRSSSSSKKGARSSKKANATSVGVPTFHGHGDDLRHECDALLAKTGHTLISVYKLYC